MQNILVQIHGLFGLLVASFIIQVFAFASPWWSVITFDNLEIRSGLWLACVSDTCAPIPSNYGLAFLAIRGLAIFGLLFGFVALIQAIRAMNFLRSNAPIPSNLETFPICSIVAGTCTLFECVAYGCSWDHINALHVQLHFSFGSAILAASVQLILGITGLVLRQRHFNAGAPPTHSFTQFDAPPTKSFAQFDAPPAQSDAQFGTSPTQTYAQFGEPPKQSFA